MIDPNTLKPNLYQAAVANDTMQVLQYLDQNVPPTYVDTRTGLTVSQQQTALIGKIKVKLYVGFALGCFEW